MYCEVVACGSLRGSKCFLEDAGVDILFGSEFFVKVELAGHLEDVLPLVVLCFSGIE